MANIFLLACLIIQFILNNFFKHIWPIVQNKINTHCTTKLKLVVFKHIYFSERSTIFQVNIKIIVAVNHAMFTEVLRGSHRRKLIIWLSQPDAHSTASREQRKSRALRGRQCLKVGTQNRKLATQIYGRIFTWVN